MQVGMRDIGSVPGGEDPVEQPTPMFLSLKSPTDKEACWAIVYRVAQSRETATEAA